MPDAQICGSCAHHEIDRDAEDFVCTNSKSEFFSDWTPHSGTCDEWEEKRREEQR